MKKLIIPFICILFLLTAAACSVSPSKEEGAAVAPAVSEASAKSETSPPAAKKDGAVLIYNGEIAAEGCPEALAAAAESLRKDVTYFDSAAELPDLLSGAAICMIGGTEDDLNPLVSEFTPEIRDELKSWIESGGGFLGICGGAYIGSMGWEEDDGFVDMLSLAPVETEEYLSSSDPQIITVKWNDEQRAVYYAFGPAFLAEDTSDIEVIAKYDDGRTAVLDYTYGKGHVVLSGPHPEADETWLDDDPAPLNSDKWEDTTDLIQELFQRLS